jgi:predicted DNA-binding transcriptional regulator YafY
VHLDYREAIDVLLSLAVAEKLGSALFLEHVRSTRNKLAATFSPAHRERIRLLRRRILIGEPASPEVLASYDAGRRPRGNAVNEAFFEMKQLEVVYSDARGKRSLRLIEPQFLYLSWPVWYLLAWDRMREDVRTFRIDRIVKAAKRTEGFALRAERPFMKAVEDTGDRL